jgi:hypothetical protein
MKTPPMELVNFLKSALKSVCPVTSVMPSNQRAIVEECIRTKEISKEYQLIIIQRSPVLLGFLQLYNPQTMRISGIFSLLTTWKSF